MSTADSVTSSRLILAAKIINILDSEILSKIMKIVCQKFLLSHSQQIFSCEEILKLQESFSLNSEELNIILSYSSYVIQQACFYLMKPTVLTDYLKGLGLNNHSAATISEVWSYNAKPIIGILKKKTSVCGTKVESVESSVNCQLSSLSGGHVKIPVGLIHLNLTADSAMEKSPTTLSLEFTKEELTRLYESLETIQNQLDKIV